MNSSFRDKSIILWHAFNASLWAFDHASFCNGQFCSTLLDGSSFL